MEYHCTTRDNVTLHTSAGRTTQKLLSFKFELSMNHKETH